MVHSGFVFVLGLVLGITLTTFVIAPLESPKSVVLSSLKREINETNEISFDQLKLDTTLVYKFLKETKKKNARMLSQTVRVLCWVMTTAGNHQEKAIHVKRTWGAHCNTLLFISDAEDTTLPAVNINATSPGREGLWSKTVNAFKYIYKHYQNQYDWVIKADDDTYLILENLREMLLPYAPTNPHYFGCHFKPHSAEGYMSGGAGYVLSKEAIHRLVTNAFDGKQNNCPPINNTNAEDANMGNCLHSIGINPDDSRDKEGKYRFLPFHVKAFLGPNAEEQPDWFWHYIYWPLEGDLLSRASFEPVSFHYVDPQSMYMIEYLSYHVQPFPVLHLSPFNVADIPKHL